MSPSNLPALADKRPLTIAKLVSGFFGISVLFAAVVIGNEATIAGAQSRLLEQNRAIDRGEIELPDRIRPSSAGTPARARLANALFRALQAKSMPFGPQRTALLDYAAQDIALARRARPYWGEAATVAAFVIRLRTDRPSTAGAVALGDSYRDAPYLRDSAQWRVQQGLRLWDHFDSTSRERILNEAVWLSRMDLPLRLAVFDLARRSPAYRPFVLRWFALRRGDPDFIAERGAP